MYDEHTRDFFFFTTFFFAKKIPVYVHRTYTEFYPTLEQNTLLLAFVLKEQL